MPYPIHVKRAGYGDIHLSAVATEEELLDFCNRVRKAGGADVLDAFLPALPGIASNCLIANSLNFGCSVGPTEFAAKADGSYSWVMWLPENLSDDQIAAISEAVGTEPLLSYDGRYKLPLPAHIGNAAHAFDLGVAFQEYDTHRVPRDTDGH